MVISNLASDSQWSRFSYLGVVSLLNLLFFLLLRRKLKLQLKKAIAPKTNNVAQTKPPKETAHIPNLVEQEEPTVPVTHSKDFVVDEIQLQDLILVANPEGNLDIQDGIFKDCNPDNNFESTATTSTSSKGLFVDSMVEVFAGTKNKKVNKAFLNEACNSLQGNFDSHCNRDNHQIEVDSICSDEVPEQEDFQLVMSKSQKKKSKQRSKLRKAYAFKCHPLPPPPWASSIWDCHIPPSKSLLVWRLQHSKVPIDDQLVRRGFNVISKCSLCNNSAESMDHLFFSCNFSLSLWHWLSKLLHLHNIVNSFDFWNTFSKASSPQGVFTIKVACIYTIYSIWEAQSVIRYFNIIPNIANIKVNICAQVKLNCDISDLCYMHNLYDFEVLKTFQITIKPPKAPLIKEIFWDPLYPVG
ncbi:unnamed protein product [Vicia faba]|uniref:Reverse transcriptase zinc-binding domain-containing protein n=1 Tax=Vicia faba TaxID=3906 RepID=A0AAV1AF07_VICFA|nr:unnamed protein product [Vicia faba]